MKNLSNFIKKKKLKTIDLLLIGFFVFALTFFAYFFFRKITYLTITVKVNEEGVKLWDWADYSGTKSWYANLFYVGQKEKDGIGKIKAEVIDVFSYYKNPTKKDVYLTIKLKTVYSRASDSYTYKGADVLIGSQIKLNLDKIHVEGLITEIDNFPEKVSREKIIVEVQLREENSTYLETSGTKSYIADAINEGEEIKDNKGNIIIKIINKKVEPAIRTVITSSGNILLKQDPLRKDIYLTLEVYATKQDNTYFLFNDIPVLVEDIIPLNTPQMAIFPIVTKIIVQNNE